MGGLIWKTKKKGVCIASEHRVYIYIDTYTLYYNNRHIEYTSFSTYRKSQEFENVVFE